MATYLLKTALCLTGFYITYRLLFEEKVNYAASRLFLVGSFVLSFVIPLITLHIPVVTLPVKSAGYLVMNEITGPPVADNLPVSAAMPESSARFPLVLFMVVYILYFIGILTFIVRYVLDIVLILRLIYKNKKQVFDSYTLVMVDKPMAPFSFFRYVFVYINDLESEGFQEFVLKHEMVHIRSWHSLDSVFLGLGQIVQWFNPVVLLYKRAIIALHEYCADRAVIENSGSLTGYQQKILEYCYQKNQLSLTSNLSNTMIKKRFHMMTNNTKGRYNALRVITATVVAAFLLLAFSNDDKISVKSLPGSSYQASAITHKRDHTLATVTLLRDTIKRTEEDQSISKEQNPVQKSDEIRILENELNTLNRERRHDSLGRYRERPLRDMELMRQHMAEMQAEMADRQREFAEQQRKMAMEQDLLTERLKPLMRDYPSDRLRNIMEGERMIKPFRPMIDEYLKNPPPVEPFFYDGNCIYMEELQLQIKELLKDMQPCEKIKPVCPLDEKDIKILREQKEWHEKYRREMEKQREEMENKRKQLLDEYSRMMEKYRQKED
jgi:hypothetical protein